MMPRFAPARFLPPDADIGRRGETREERRRRRLAERERKIAARQERQAARAEIRRDRKEARMEARDRKRTGGRGGRSPDERRARRRKTLEDAGNALEALDEATDDGGLLAEYLPPGGGEEEEGEIEELPADDGFGEDGSSAKSWSAPARLGRMRIQTRRGTRAATIELRPGLYLVAEIPERALAGIGGPVKLAAKVVDAAARAMQRKPAPKEIPGPAPAAPKPPGKRRWRDRNADHAVGCDGECRCRWEQE